MTNARNLRGKHEVIVRGVRKRAVIRTESFSRRVQEKTSLKP